MAADGVTALHVASHKGNLDEVRVLLAHGADLNAVMTNAGATALYLASMASHVEVVRVLLEHGADLNIATTSKHASTTALHKASQTGQVELVRLLLKHKADPNITRAHTGGTALHMAVEDGHVEVVQLLLTHGADPNIATTDKYGGATALHVGTENGQVEVVPLLLEHKADPNIAITSTGVTALHMAVEGGHMEVVRVLLAYSADPNMATADEYGCITTLHVAAMNSHARTAQLLAVHGATLGHTDNHGRTAQQFAADSGHNQLANWFGAVANHTPFQIAVGCRMHAEARSLLRTSTLGDPTTCRLAEVMQAATGTTAWGVRTVAMPPVCPATTRLACAAMQCWTPVRHWLFHSRFREAVHTVLLVLERLGERPASTPASAGGAALPSLPDELWFLVCSMLLRRDWA